MKNIIIKVKEIDNSSKIISKLKANKKKLDKFFNIELPLPLLIILQNRQQINSVWNRKLEVWSVAWAWRGSCIFILSPKAYLKENSSRTELQYRKILCHEHVHLYLQSFKIDHLPRWLVEGIPTYLAGQKHRKPTLEEVFSVIKQSNNKPELIYIVGLYWVEKLIRKFGKKKLLILLSNLKSCRNEKQFTDIFYQIYKIKYTKKDFRRLLDGK